MSGEAPSDRVPVPVAPHARNRRPDLSLPWWALAYAFVTTAGLAMLVWAILVLDALSYGVFQVLDVAAVGPPVVDRYSTAFAVAVAVNLGSTLALSRLALRTSAAAWPPVLAGLLVALVTGTVAACVLLLMLGIDPVDVVTAY